MPEENREESIGKKTAGISETGKKLPRSFYEQPDVVEISRQLLGKVLCTRTNGQLTTGMIVETEAYSGRDDRACHANDGLRTARTEIMYGPGGYAYVYLCYGIHHLFNVVTNHTGLADAILVRAVEPLDNPGVMMQRRQRTEPGVHLTNGPGKLTQALRIKTTDSGEDLLGDRIWIEDRGVTLSVRQIEASPRIGVDYAGDHARRPWRFTLRDSPWVSQ